MTALTAVSRLERTRLVVQGTVQGVGFRPYVYRAAAACGVSGWVANDPAGVTIEVEGDPLALARFVSEVQAAPAPASVGRIRAIPLSPTGKTGFVIRTSRASGSPTASVLPDLATCEECLREIRDPGDRRYRYPFTNCTHCGPRYAIVEALPYDRARTTMRAFPMCEACVSEYRDPMDRRFHAEPIACPACGPQLALWNADGEITATKHDALLATAEAIRSGKIVAMKGLGGFHLLADARNDTAVATLRLRKHRPDKPFAVMAPSIEAARAIAEVDAAEIALLVSPERSITLLRRRGSGIAQGVTPAGGTIGVMLPYTPLHHLLLDELGFPVVATSGNRSDEPIVIDEGEAIARLGGIADLFLVHDRPIARPIDDSVMRVVAGRPMMLRRARGFAPSLAVQREMPPGLLAYGGHLKNTVALTTREGIVLSQHIGDLETVEARDAQTRGIADLTTLYATPARIAVRDLHPDYHASHAATASHLPVIAVQHHLAHVAAVMAEHDLAGPVLGVSWDGTGDGGDGTVWGGEFLRVDGDVWKRVAALRPFRLPGGEAAIREPRRAAFGLLYAIFGRDALEMAGLAPVASFSPAERNTLAEMIDRQVNAPVTTSAGRLFDAVSALLAIRQRATYEGQAAQELEWAAEDGDTAALRDCATALSERDGLAVVDWEPTLRAIIAGQLAGIPPATVSRSFHQALAGAIAAVAGRLAIPSVVLAGGCFQNKRLTEASVDALRAANFAAYWPEKIPPNDGGLALGQAAWAARQLNKERNDVPRRTG